MENITQPCLQETRDSSFINPSRIAAPVPFVAPVAPVAPMLDSTGVNNDSEAATPDPTSSTPPPKQFSDLPAEIQCIIWSFAANGRVVIVDHTINPGMRASQDNIIESYQALLGVNYQFRQIAEKIGYRSLFTKPLIRQGRWKLRYLANQQQADQCIKTMPFIVEDTGLIYIYIYIYIRGRSPSVRKIDTYMNKQPELGEDFQGFVFLKEPIIRGHFGPAYFNPTLDTLYLRREVSQFDRLQAFADRFGHLPSGRPRQAFKVSPSSSSLLPLSADPSPLENINDIRHLMAISNICVGYKLFHSSS